MEPERRIVYDDHEEPTDTEIFLSSFGHLYPVLKPGDLGSEWNGQLSAFISASGARNGSKKSPSRRGCSICRPILPI